MPSLARTIKHARAAGWKEWFRMMTYIGDAKKGELVGKDQFGNRYYQNYDPKEEVPGRQRWVDYAQDDFNASQAAAGWRSWLQHTRLDVPPNDPVYQACEQKWQLPYRENMTGTRGRYISYNTTAPKVEAWQPETKARK